MFKKRGNFCKSLGKTRVKQGKVREMESLLQFEESRKHETISSKVEIISYQ